MSSTTAPSAPAPASTPSNATPTTAPAAPTTPSAPPKKSITDIALEVGRKHGMFKDVAPAKPEPTKTEAAKGPQRGEDGKFVPAPKQEQPADAKAPTGSDGAKTDKDAQSRTERAIQGLRRAKVPQGLIDRMSEEERTEMGLQLFEDQREIDRKLSEKGKSKESRQAEPVKAGTPQVQAEDLPDIDVKALAESLLLDEEGAKRLDGYTKTLSERFAAQSAKAVEAARDEAYENVSGVAVDVVLSQLAGTYPELSVADVRGRVEAKMEALFPAYEDMPFMDGVRLCAQDAISIVCRDSILARKTATETAKTNAVNASQPPSPATNRSDGALPGENVYSMASRLILGGMSAEEARVHVNRAFKKN